ncbi:MAG: superoxide dismutase [Parcubacteria group bacterium]|nr:superoxide dismutase [Parcubacteria group bacterium]
MYQLPQLPYAYDALEPFIDEATMTIHHGKHHAAYVEKLNAALDAYPQGKNLSLERFLSAPDDLPESIRVAIRNNGGGHYNHSFFWKTLGLGKTFSLESRVGGALKDAFGDFDDFQKQFSDAALKVFGSGWTWLVRHEGALKVVSLPNQDCPLMYDYQPLLGLDIWEHAYYLKYQNRRAEYISAFWNIVDWEAVEKIFNAL